MLAYVVHCDNVFFVHLMTTMLLSWLAYRLINRIWISLLAGMLGALAIEGMVYPYLSFDFFFCSKEMFEWDRESLIILTLHLVPPIIMFLLMIKLLRYMQIEEKAKEKWWVLVGIFIFLVFLGLPPKQLSDLQANANKARNDLGVLRGTQEIWKQMDYDRNGIQDYWTYDVSCLYRIKDKDGNPIMMIDVQFAKADTNPAKDYIFGIGYIKKSLIIPPSSSAGYYFRAMLYDENGIPYNQNEVETTKVKATNSSKWAFVAYPAAYGTSGRRTFIINEEGITYSTDCGSFEKGIILQWPGKDPTKVKGPGGKYWEKAE